METAIVVVGDELLSGHVQDANGHFIAGRVAACGHRLRWIAVVGDDPALIAAAVRRGLGTARLVFVTGGVGPTHDDRTMEGVATALDVPLEVCAPIAERVELVAIHAERAGGLGAALGLEGLRKMALAPRGAEALPAARGLIPAVAVEAASGGTVVVLPGPPGELRAVFREAVEPRFLAGSGEEVHRREIAHPFPESAVARMLTDAAGEAPGVSIGSYPMEDHSLIRITGPREAVDSLAGRLEAALRAMEESDDGRRLVAFVKGRRSERRG